VTKRKLIAKAILLDDEGRLLSLRRSSTDPHRPGGKDFPGGTVEDGEHLEQAVIREIEEEVGIVLREDQVALAYATTTFFDGINDMRFLFVGRVKTGTPVKLSWEHDAYVWATPSEHLKDFKHPVWSEGLKYLLEHDLLPR